MPDEVKEPVKLLQAKIPESKRNEIKAYAAARGISFHQLLLNMFEEYKKNNGKR